MRFLEVLCSIHRSGIDHYILLSFALLLLAVCLCSGTLLSVALPIFIFGLSYIFLTDLLTQSTEAAAKEPLHTIDLPDLCSGLFWCISRYLSENV